MRQSTYSEFACIFWTVLNYFGVHLLSSSNSQAKRLTAVAVSTRRRARCVHENCSGHRMALFVSWACFLRAIRA